MKDDVQKLAKVALEEIRRILADIPDPQVQSISVTKINHDLTQTSLTIEMGILESLSLSYTKRVRS